MLDINLSCRTCMKSDHNLVHLNEPVNIDENSNIQLVQLLLECAAILVNENDGLPQNICRECIKVLQSTYAFRSQAAKAEEQFRILLQNNVKQEIKAEHEQDYFETYDEFNYENFKSELEEKHDEEIYQEKKSYTCPTCNKNYTKEKRYLKHLELHSAPHSCSYCGKQFLKEEAFLKHLSKHAVHQCQICGDIFSDDSLLLQHIASHNTIKNEQEEHEQKPSYPCSKCDQTYSCARSLNLHQKKHKKGKPEIYTCDVCQKEFVSKALVKRHLKLHVQEKQFKCSECGKSYSRSDQLKVHMKTHAEQKSNVCPYCNKAFIQLCSLKDHIRTHTGETPYLCSECGRGFANSSNLRQHMLRHTGEKPFSCKLCPKTFCTKGKSIHELQTVKENIVRKPVSILIGGDGLPTCQMTAHHATHTGAHPYACDKCGASFTKPTSLKKHANIHTGQRPYGCDSCLMRFTCKDHLKRHYRIHTGEKPYKCRYCERAFTQSNDRTKHMRTHLGQNIYDCSVCGVRFRLKSELKKHYSVHFSDDGTMKDPKTNLENLQTDTQTDPSHTDQSGTFPQKTQTKQFVANEYISDTQTNTLEMGADSQVNNKKMEIDKFMITINDANGIVAINIEPETR